MSSRVNKILRRSPAYNLNRMIFAIVMSVVLGNGSERGGDTWTTAQADGRFGVIFFSIFVMGIYSIISVIPEMKKIRDVFYKQRASGMMAHHAVVFSIIVAEMPYIFLVSVMFSASFFFCLGSGGNTSVTKFCWFCFFFTLSAATYTCFGQLFISLVKDIPTSSALASALIGINLFGSGYIIKPKFGAGPFLPIFYISPGHYAYEGILMSHFKGLNTSVVADPGSGYYLYLDCEGEDNCTGTLEDYTSFTFGEKFSYGNYYVDATILVSYLVFAIIATHFALGRFNHVNT